MRVLLPHLFSIFSSVKTEQIQDCIYFIDRARREFTESTVFRFRDHGIHSAIDETDIFRSTGRASDPTDLCSVTTVTLYYDKVYRKCSVIYNIKLHRD